jgi:hypothetical protein
MDLFHKLMELVDKNSDKIPEGDYLEMCDTIQKLREQVKPPPFLLDQTLPMLLPSEPQQTSQEMNDPGEEIIYPGLYYE